MSMSYWGLNHEPSVMERQRSLCHTVCGNLSKALGFRDEFQIEANKPETMFGLMAAEIDFWKINAAALALACQKDAAQWEEALEAESTLIPTEFPPNPYVKIFNTLAEKQNTSIFVKESGPKKYVTARAKSIATGKALESLPDINRIMVETTDPAHGEQIQTLANQGRAPDKPKILFSETLDLDGFFADAYTVRFNNCSTGEISIVPSGFHEISPATHPALRYTRMVRPGAEQTGAQALYQDIQRNIAEAIQKTNFGVAELVIQTLRLDQFEIEQSLKKIKELRILTKRCLLERPENMAWREKYNKLHPESRIG